jgi:hypothetical protein
MAHHRQQQDYLNSKKYQAAPVRARWERETRTGGGEKKGRQAEREREMLSETDKLVGRITTLAASLTKWLVVRGINLQSSK